MESAREHQTSFQARGPKKRTGTSKYDFFKVKVWLGENMDHYYILSRFLICRMLTVTKIPYIKAVKIALETKKYLVDNNLTDITQSQLEEVLFSIIRSKGFDEQYIDCYRMVTQFYQSRQPLCIVICGTAWTGKSSIAQQLASRINIPNVMQTDVIYELLRAGADSPLARQPLWCRSGVSDRVLVGEFRREARVVRKGMEGDLIKTLSDGKPIIIEGMHLDPGLYIHDFGQRGIIMLPARPTTAMQLTRSLRPGPSAGDTASRPLYKRSLTAMAGTRPSATLPICPAEAEAPEANAAAADCGRQFGRCVSADAELPVLEAQASAVGSRAGRPRPLSAGLAGRRDPASGSGEGLSVVAEVCATVPAADDLRIVEDTACVQAQSQGSIVGQHSHRHKQTLPMNLHQSWTCAPATGNGVARSTDTCPAASATASASPAGAATPQQLQSSSDVFTASAFIPSNSSSSFLAYHSVHGSKELMTFAAADSSAGQLNLSVHAADAIAAAAGSNNSCGSPSEKLPAVPTVIMLDQLQVCAATAEAVALQQQALQLEQQQRLSVSLGSPVSPLSDSTATAGPSACISQEHSTTEVISRQPSLSSPSSAPISQEPSASELVRGSGCNTTAVSWQQGAVCAATAAGTPATSLSSSVGADYLRGMIQSQQQRGLQDESVIRALSGGSCMVLGAGDTQLGPAPRSQSHQTPVIADVAGDNSSTPSTPPVAALVIEQGLTTASNAVASGAPVAQQQEVMSQTLPHSRQGGPVSNAFNCQHSEPAADSKTEAAEQSGTTVPQAVDSQLADGCNSEQHTTATSSSKSSSCGNQQPDTKGPVHKPLFVPVLVYMDEADHVLMQEEALSHMGNSGSCTSALESAAVASLVKHGLVGNKASNAAPGTPAGVDAGTAAAGGPSNGADESLETAAVGSQEALRRMRLLQEYLCAYEAQGLPVVKVSYGNFGEALDKLHEYILQCIKVAMQL